MKKELTVNMGSELSNIQSFAVNAVFYKIHGVTLALPGDGELIFLWANMGESSFRVCEGFFVFYDQIQERTLFKWRNPGKTGLFNVRVFVLHSSGEKSQGSVLGIRCSQKISALLNIVLQYVEGVNLQSLKPSIYQLITFQIPK